MWDLVLCVSRISVAFVFSTALLLLVFLLWVHKYWTEHGFYQIKPHLVYGNLKPYFRHNVDFGSLLRNYYNAAEGLRYVGLYMTWRPALLVCDPAVIKHLFRDNFNSFNTRHLSSSKEKCPLLNNMYQRCGDESWKKERDLLANAFSQANIHDLYDTISTDATDRLNYFLEDLCDSAANICNANKLFEKHLYNVIASFIYGVQIDTFAYSKESFRCFGNELFRPRCYRFWEKISFAKQFILPTKWDRFLNFRQHSKRVEDFYVSLTKHTVNSREGNKKEWNAYNDYMQFLLKIRNSGELQEDETYRRMRAEPGACQYLTMMEMSTQAFLAFTSGFPYMLTTLTFFMYEVARNHVIQEKLVTEIEDTYERTDASPVYSDIQMMRYLECCLNECFRKYPPCPYLVRYCTKDFIMQRESFVLKKGTPIFVSILGIHHDPKFYPNPLQFNPDRTYNVGRQLTFLPFGIGEKKCLGMDLARAILKIHIVFILGRYTVSLGPNMKPSEINFENGYLEEARRINLAFEYRLDETVSADE